MSTPEWERSKENVAPVSRGRNVETLNKALQKSAADLEQEREFHQAAIRDASSGTGPYASDPLAPWVSFAKWAVDNFPRGSELIVAAVEGACRRFSKDERYREDRRFVRLWIRYADMRNDKLDVFTYMQKRRIGESAALFYEAWATTLELERQFDRAEATYALGRRMKAEPQSRLSQREREFFNRMAARRKRAEKKAKDAEEKKKVASKARENSAANRGRATLADKILSTADVEEAENLAIGDENSAPKVSRGGLARPALGRITETEAQTGRRPMALAQSRMQTESRERSQENFPPQNNGKRKADKIEVYVDQQAASIPSGSANEELWGEDGQSQLPLLAKRDEVHKENDGKPSKWAGETLRQNENAKTKLRRGLATRPAFEILHDPDTPEHADSRDDRDWVPRQQSGNIGKQSPPTKLLRKSAGNVAPSSPTINTKIAMRDIDDMFNSSLPMEREREKVLAECVPLQTIADDKQLKKAATPFQIYQDTDDSNEKENAFSSNNRFSNDAPSDNPALERRVLKPIPEHDVPGAEAVPVDHNNKIDDAVGRNKAPVLVKKTPRKHMESDDLLNFLAEWCSSENDYYLLNGPDPEVEKGGNFKLQPKQSPISTSKFAFRPTPHGAVEFNVDNFLWTGYEGVSRVVPVEDTNDVYGLSDRSGVENEHADDLLALKASESSNAWEFYVYKTLHDRYGATLKSIPTAIAFYEGSPRTYLVLDSYCTSSLSQTMKLQGDKHFTENVAMFFAADLLRTLEAVHTVGIIHCDVTLDNVMFRDSPGVEIVEDRYVPGGAGSWSSKGVLLVDFNHSVDSKQVEGTENSLKALAEHITKLGNEFLHPEYRIPNCTSWSFNIDCYAAAVCVAKMLGLSKLGIRGSEISLKHERVWNRFFSDMQSLTAACGANETVEIMKQCRGDMERALQGEKWLKRAIMGLSAQVESCNIRDDASNPPA